MAQKFEHKLIRDFEGLVSDKLMKQAQQVQALQNLLEITRGQSSRFSAGLLKNHVKLQDENRVIKSRILDLERELEDATYASKNLQEVKAKL